MREVSIDFEYRPADYRGLPRIVTVDGLPEGLPDECELARVVFREGQGSPISIRARPLNPGYAYRLVDAYATSFWHRPQRSSQPLSMSELVALIDNCSHSLGFGLTSAFRQMNRNAGARLDTLESLVSVESDIYPELRRHYEREARQWVERARQEESGLTEPDAILEREVRALRHRLATRLAPALHPFELPDYRRIDELSDMERAQLARWLRRVTGWPGCTVTWTQPDVRARNRSARQTVFEVRYGPSSADTIEIRRGLASAVRYPTVRSLFSTLAATYRSELPAKRDLQTAGSTGEVQALADDAWFDGDIATAGLAFEQLQTVAIRDGWSDTPLIQWLSDSLVIAKEPKAAEMTWYRAACSSSVAGTRMFAMVQMAVIAELRGRNRLARTLLRTARNQLR